MTILEEIMAHKRKEVAQAEELRPIKLLEKSIFFETPSVSMSEYLKREDKVGIIAEIKRASPSLGMIHEYADVEQLSIGYMQAGASALSVLSDTKYFGGTLKDIEIARKFNYCPILRKDFMLSEYQLIEAKSHGADCILLIAAALDSQTSKGLSRTAKQLGLEVLLEVHNKEEIDEYASEDVDVIGVNNRNLHDFTTNIQTSIDLSDNIPSEFVKISESGISNPEAIQQLKEVGFDGFLIGGYFMEHAQPEEACANLIKAVKEKK
ncbi:MAG: indole-3-glycerol phosphate synthase TrpC [Flavobacteriales bacterium]|nr:indole-3-glycerol phosphate synthase TrpC [Flavobacteriales bacterium]